MCKAFLTYFVLAMMVNLGTLAAEPSSLTSWPPGTNWQSNAKLTADPTPPGCLYLWSKSYSLEGRLGGAAVPADPQETPPIESHSFIYFYLDKPISVCASKESLGKAWTNVTRLAMGVRSEEFFHYLVKYWGRWEHVRVIAATLGNVNTALPGPIGIDNFSKICFRGQLHGKVGSLWWCMSGKTWGKLYQESEQWINGWR